MLRPSNAELPSLLASREQHHTVFLLNVCFGRLVELKVQLWESSISEKLNDIECLLHARHCSKSFTCINTSFNS